jgi:hypothetical protein
MIFSFKSKQQECATLIYRLEGVYESQGTFKGMVGSHEPAGVVVKLGPKAESEGTVKLGDRVGSINVSIKGYLYCLFSFLTFRIVPTHRHTATVVNAMHASTMVVNCVKSYLVFSV